MLTYVLYGLYILACAALVLSVLLQPGKADAGALFTSSVSSTTFGPRGTQTLLAKITIGAAALFLLIALMLSLPALTGTRSVLQTESESGAAPAPTTTVAPTPQSAETPVASPAAASDAPATNPDAAMTPAPTGSPQGEASPGTR